MPPAWHAGPRIDVHGEDFGVPTVDVDTTIVFDLICFFDSLEHFPQFDALSGLRAANAIVSLPAVRIFSWIARTLASLQAGRAFALFLPRKPGCADVQMGLPRKLVEARRKTSFAGNS